MQICTKCLQELVDSDKECYKCHSVDILTTDEYKICREFFMHHPKDIKIYTDYPYKIYLEYLKYKEMLEKKEFDRLHPSYGAYSAVKIIQPTSPTITCPYCQSTDCKKISSLSKAGSVALWGIFALGKTTKQWHCNNCKSDF